MQEKLNTKAIVNIIKNIEIDFDVKIPLISLTGFSSISETQPYTLSWMRKQDLDWSTIRASVVICSKGVEKPEKHPCILIPVNNPRLIFTKILQSFADNKIKPKIEQTAIIGKNCQIDPSVYVGHYTVIGDNVKIGKNSIIRHHVIINENTIIGDNALLKSHCVIGEKGFGFEDEKGLPQGIPHVGGVVIGDFVEIGTFTTIVKGTIGNTIIKDYVKLDDHIHIAHNVVLNEAVMIAACAEVSGSTNIGKNTWVAPNSSIIDGITIGENVIIGIGSVINKEVEDKAIIRGNPGKVLKYNK